MGEPTGEPKSGPTKAPPRADRDSRPFWDGCAAHEIRVQRCLGCSAMRFPPGEFCPRCHCQQAEWVTLPGTGRLQSFVIVHRAFDPAFSADVPYVTGLVALDATSPPVVLPAGVRGLDPEEVRVGLPVVARYEQLRGERTGEWAIPSFWPVEGVSQG